MEEAFLARIPEPKECQMSKKGNELKTCKILIKQGKLSKNNTICKETRFGCIYKAECIIWFKCRIGRNRVGREPRNFSICL